MILAYIVKLGLNTQKINIKAQNIDGSPLQTYEIALAKFLIQDSLEKI